MARAYAYRDARSHAFVIYDEEIPVGMGLYHDCAPLNAYDFSQLFIDQRYQGRGYGLAATNMVLNPYLFLRGCVCGIQSLLFSDSGIQ